MASEGNTAAALHVVFGAGPLGIAVAEAALARGHSVTLATRSGSRNVPSGARTVRCDATRGSEVAESCAGARAIYNCAQPPFTQWPELFPAIQRGLIDGAGRCGAVLVAGENLYMYGPVEGPLTEDLPYQAQTRKGQVRAQMASELQEAYATGRARTTAGRASSFFGPRVIESFMGPRMLRPAFTGGIVRVIGDPDQPHTYTYIRDFAEGLVTLAGDDRALGRAWHVPSAETLTTRRFLMLAGTIAGAGPTIRRVPSVVVKLGARFIPLLREVREMLYGFERPFIVDHSRFASAFGAKPTPHEQALRETLAAGAGSS